MSGRASPIIGITGEDGSYLAELLDKGYRARLAGGFEHARHSDTVNSAVSVG